MGEAAGGRAEERARDILGLGSSRLGGNFRAGADADLRRTAEVARLRRSRGATAARRATATAERCRNIVVVVVVVVFVCRRWVVWRRGGRGVWVGWVKPALLDLRNGLIWAKVGAPAAEQCEVFAVFGLGHT